MSNRIANTPIIEIAGSFMLNFLAAKWYAMGEARIAVAIEDNRWHMSISCKDRDPTWDEIATARYRLIPDKITMAMFLPPMHEYVNLHDHVFHLHETMDV